MADSKTTPAATITDLLFARSPDGLCLVSPDGTVVRANAEWLRSTGATEEQVIGEDILELFPATRDMALALHERARAGHHVRVPLHARMVNGREAWWEGSIEPVAMEGGTGLLITAREVPEVARGAPGVGDWLARMRQIADHARAAVFVKSADGRYLFVNRWLESLLGLAPGAALGRTVADLMPPEIARRTAERERIAARGREVTTEEIIPTPRGARVLMVVRFPYPLGDESVGTVGLGLDVTEHRRAEAALRESEERFRVLSQAMTQIVCVLGPDGTPEYVNPTWVEFSGLGLEATRGVGWAGVLHPDDLERALACRRLALRTRTPQEEELRYRAADGTHRWFLSRLVPVVEGARVVRLIGAGVEIDRLKRTEDALRTREAQFEVLIEELHSGVALIDVAGKFTLYNRRFLELFGLSRDADVANVNSQDWSAWQVFDEEGRPLQADDHPVRKAALTRRPVHGQLVAIRLPAGGELRWMLVSAEPMLRPDGSTSQIVCTYNDVTDRRRAEEALREVDRRKDEFLGMLGHELRNPLAPIRNSTFILRHAQAGSEQAHRAQQVIERQTEHLARLVDDLLDVTRIGRGKIELRRSNVDLREVVMRAADDFRLPMDDGGVSFRMSLPEEPVRAHVDATRITQLVGNLLTNAAKFTRRGDEVTLSLSVEDGEARILVRDTGAGIDPALVTSIFLPFVQGERTLARTEGGLGLGLALVKGVAELHGGSVTVTSAGKGKGAGFLVRFPLVAPQAPEPGDALHAARSQGGRRVLVVDDNVDAAESLAEIVRMLGHRADVVHDGPSAIDRVRAGAPDVVLCDIGLPGMSGYEVAKALRRMEPGVELIAVSGYAQPEDVERAIEAGFDGHVAKPCDPTRIERLLG
jgi:PAS domain S-box-containing protein